MPDQGKCDINLHIILLTDEHQLACSNDLNGISKINI